MPRSHIDAGSYCAIHRATGWSTNRMQTIASSPLIAASHNSHAGAGYRAMRGSSTERECHRARACANEACREPPPRHQTGTRRRLVRGQLSTVSERIDARTKEQGFVRGLDKTYAAASPVPFDASLVRWRGVADARSSVIVHVSRGTWHVHDS
jgi:hypothetical protein